MKISSDGLNLIKRYEGLRLTAYQCAAGVWTIGYGSTKGVKPGMTITEAQATQRLLDDVARFEKAVNKYVTLYNFNQSQFDALVSFTFNCGEKNLNKLTQNGLRSKNEVSAHITDFNKARVNGVLKELSGLTRRRNEEKALFDKGSTPKVISEYPTIKRGSKNEVVKIAQRLLVERGYDLGVVDGIFGAKTDAAVRKFQSDNGLLIDGIIGEKTWKALKSNQ